MIGKYVKGSVCAFIDAENIFYTQQTLRWHISYRRLMKYLRRECGKEVECNIYKGIDPSNVNQKKFIDMLEINMYIVHTKNVKKIRTLDNKFKWKNNLDVELAIDLIEQGHDFDTIILFSGDSDFASPLKRLRDAGKTILVASTRGHISKELIQVSKYIDLKKIRDEIELINVFDIKDRPKAALSFDTITSIHNNRPQSN